MITLAFRFPGGRYHATPWGHHVNEGLVEWPPSPWRVLRALISAGYTRMGWSPGPPEEARALIEALASALPSYTVPSATLAHSRHYMPVPGGKPTLVMDAWAQVGTGELWVHWPVDLDSAQAALLAKLVASLDYLGRAESWVEGRLLGANESAPRANVIAYEQAAPGPSADTSEMELVPLAAPLSPEQYRLWREQGAPAPETDAGKRTKAQQKGRMKEQAPFPETLLDAMQWDTARWKDLGWSQAPGLQRVLYRRPKQALAAWIPSVAPAATGGPIADTVLLALATPSGNRSALPALSRTLPQAEILHKSLVAHSGRQGSVAPALSGCDAEQRPLKGHRHAHILPLDLDRDGHLDHVLLWAPMGFDRAALEAVHSLRVTWTKGGAGELRVAVAGQAWRKDLKPGVEGLERYLAPARIWVSLSPFVPPRFLKKNGANSAQGQIESELLTRGLPKPERIRLAAFPAPEDLPESQAAHFRHYIRRRQRGGQPPPQDCGWFVTLEFAEMVLGPLCLGYGSHFGLGLFVGRTG